MSDSGQTIPSTWERRADAFVAALQRNAMDNPEWVLAQLLENAFNEGREYAKRYDDVAPPLPAGPVAPPPDVEDLAARFIDAAEAYRIHSELSFTSPISYTVGMMKARNALWAALGEAPRGAAPPPDMRDEHIRVVRTAAERERAIGFSYQNTRPDVAKEYYWRADALFAAVNALEALRGAARPPQPQIVSHESRSPDGDGQQETVEPPATAAAPKRSKPAADVPAGSEPADSLTNNQGHAAMSDDEAFKVLRACQRYCEGEGSFQAALDAIKGAARRLASQPALEALIARYREEGEQSKVDAAQFQRDGKDWRDVLTLSARAACFLRVADELTALAVPPEAPPP